MTTIALFHSVLGVRPGILDAAGLLRSHGHTVHVIDLFEERVFDDYKPAAAYAEGIGYSGLMALAAAATADLADGFVTMGFSSGAALAEYIACSRSGVLAVVMLSGALDPAEIGGAWPAGVPGQIHFTKDDPWREQSGIDAVISAAKASDAEVEPFDYPGSGHLFTDASKVDEFQSTEAERLWSTVMDFLDRVDAAH